MSAVKLCFSGNRALLAAASRSPWRRFWSTTPTTFAVKSNEAMSQVEVDEENVRKKLGNVQMNFVKKAERDNKERASRHVKLRRTDWMIGGTCIAIALSIYGYTIFAMKQETFLDDFEMPEPLPEERRLKK